MVVFFVVRFLLILTIRFCYIRREEVLIIFYRKDISEERVSEYEVKVREKERERVSE